MPPSTEKRLESLERELSDVKRQYRCLQVGVGLALATVALGWTWNGIGEATPAESAVTQDDTIRAGTVIAGNFLVEAEDGMRVGGLGWVEDVGTALMFIDQEGSTRLLLRAGGSAASRFAFYGAAGQERLALGVPEDGPTGLIFKDETGQLRAGIAVSEEDGAGLQLLDKEGILRASLGAGSTETPDGRKTTYPEASLRLSDPEGNIIWSAPP